MRKLCEAIDRLLNSLCVAMMGALAIIVIVSVFQRYVFGKGYIWAEELVSMLFVATTLIGAVIGVRQKEHITISFIRDMMPVKFQHLCQVTTAILSIIVQIVIIVVSIQWIAVVGNVLSPVIRLPLKYFYYMLPTSAVLLIIYELFDIVMLVSDMKQAGKSRQTTTMSDGGL